MRDTWIYLQDSYKYTHYAQYPKGLENYMHTVKIEKEM